MQNKQKDGSLEEFSPVFGKITKRLGLLSAGDRTVIPEEWKGPVLDGLHFGHPGSTKLLAESGK